MSLGSVTGSISAAGNITLLAMGSLSGDLVVTNFGYIQAYAFGNIDSSKIVATGDIDLISLGNINAPDVESKYSSVIERAADTLFSNATAGGDIFLSADILSSRSATNTDGAVPICFVAGTRILLPGGMNQVIEKLEPGLKVPAIPENDPDGNLRECRVSQVFHNPPARIWEVQVANHTIRTTACHPFFVRGKGWVQAAKLTRGDELRTQFGTFLKVQSVTDSGKDEPVFNLEVEDHHTYFVMLPESDKAVWVHNKPSGGEEDDVETEKEINEAEKEFDRVQNLKNHIEEEAEREKISYWAAFDEEAEKNEIRKFLSEDNEAHGGNGTTVDGDDITGLREAEKEALQRDAQEAAQKDTKAIERGLDDPETTVQTLVRLSNRARSAAQYRYTSPIIRYGMRQSQIEETIMLGTPQNTNPTRQAPEVNEHYQTVEKTGEEMAKSGEYRYIIYNRSISTGSGGDVSGIQRPDIIGIRWDGRIDLREIVSPGQTRESQIEKLEPIMKKIPEERQGNIDAISPPQK